MKNKIAQFWDVEREINSLSALQLVESVTLGHVMMETVLHGVDIEAKKKQVPSATNNVTFSLNAIDANMMLFSMLIDW